MIWSSDKTIPAMVNKSKELRDVFAKVANSAIETGVSGLTSSESNRLFATALETTLQQTKQSADLAVALSA